MYRIIDNFLSDSDFNLFSIVTKKIAKNKWGTNTSRHNDPHWYNCIFTSEVDNIQNAVSKRFSSHVWDVAEAVNNKMQEEIHALPSLFSLGYLFSNHTYRVKPHYDNIYKNCKLNDPSYVADSYSAFLYGHSEWDPNWGGILGFHKNFFVDMGKSENFDKDNYFPIEPKPNRLVYYSLNEFHSVTPITKTDVIRQTLKMSFFKNTKTRRHPKAIDSQIDHSIEF